MASTPPGIDAKMPADDTAATTSCPRVCTLSRPSKTLPSASCTNAAPLISSVARGYSPSVLPSYVPAVTDDDKDIVTCNKKMAVPVTSALLVVDLIPVASHETSPVETLDDAELKCVF